MPTVAFSSIGTPPTQQKKLAVEASKMKSLEASKFEGRPPRPGDTLVSPRTIKNQQLPSGK